MNDMTKKDEQGEEIIHQKISYDGTYFLVLMLKYKWFLIITVFLATAGATVFSLYMPNWYSASINAVPSKSQSSLFDNVIGGISSALKEFGMTKLGGAASTDSYDFIVLMQSRTIQDSLIEKFNLAKEYDIPDTERTKIYQELDDNFEVTYEKEGNYTATIYSKDKYKAVEMINYFIELVNQIAQRVSKEDATMNRIVLENRIRQTDSVVAVISDSLARYSKKNFLISVEEQAKASSSAYADLKSELIKQETVYEMYKNRLGSNDAYTKMMAELVSSLKDKLEKAKVEPGFAGNFSLENATGVGIEYMRLLAEFETFTKVKSILLPMLEEAKLEESKKAQTLIIIDPPRVADKKSRPKRSLIVAGSALGTFVLCMVFIIMFDGYRNFKKRYNALTIN
ncbi:hypothetical protein D9V86_01100 [Bacteroidetes/Chlorobi group bacterium ChocPot_Mid]|jgi:capsule polysaccharide export protein KpsE/RkpR|nr:MAG: hypothetical protein D9V86_01100 [Bacteroidetes/Chlorobi group bacterium ChocPot_Mid]